MSATPDQIVLVHISDVHIGTALIPTEYPLHRGPESGYNPHEHRLLQPLENAIEDARRRAEIERDKIKIVMSGDLTQSGLHNDYATAFALFHERWQWKENRQIGLGWPRDSVVMVPGNHDHWAHKTRPYARSPAISTYFTTTPWKKELDSTLGGFHLELFGVDLNSGLGESGDRVSKRNRFARGAISSEELNRLEALLQQTQPSASRVRAIVCHHAFSSRGLARPLVGDSRKALVALCVKHGIVAALTGHTHKFHHEDWPRGAEGKTVKELRCGSTLQAKVRRWPSSSPHQGFWFHQIVKEGTGLKWKATKYQLAGGRFEANIKHRVRFQIA